MCWLSDLRVCVLFDLLGIVIVCVGVWILVLFDVYLWGLIHFNSVVVASFFGVVFILLICCF